MVSLPEHVEDWGRDRARAVRGLRRLGWWAELSLTVAGIGGVFLLSRGLPLVVGNRFTGATGAFVPVFALLPLLPLPILAAQGAALQLRPGAALADDAAGLVAFIIAALALVPLWGAAGAAAALLVAVAVSAAVSAWQLSQVVTARFLAAGLAGTATVLALGAALGLMR